MADVVFDLVRLDELKDKLNFSGYIQYDEDDEGNTIPMSLFQDGNSVVMHGEVCRILSLDTNHVILQTLNSSNEPNESDYVFVLPRETYNRVCCVCC